MSAIERHHLWLPIIGLAWLALAGLSHGIGEAAAEPLYVPAYITQPWPVTDIPSLPPQAGAHTGREWTLDLRTVASLIFTDNVSLAPPGQEQADSVLALSLPIAFRRDGRRLKVRVDYTPTLYQYARSRPASDVQHDLRSLLTLEAVDDFFFIDATANIAPTYILPTGPRPMSGASITNNRTQETLIGVSPYIRHETGSGWSYLIRNDNFWDTYNTSQLPGVQTSKLAADVKSPPARLRYGFDYTYLYTRFESQPTAYHEQVARVRPILALTPRLELSARVGYETNDYSPNRYSSMVYGAGLDWTPTARTKLAGYLEHRFFGTSYSLDFNHRTRLTAWRLKATRDVYLTAEQPFALQAGTNPQVLNDILRAQIADPVQREQVVNQFLERLGLPPGTALPFSFFTNQVYVAKRISASAGLMGKRNTALVELLYEDDDPLTTPTGVPSGFFTASRVRQQGLRVTLSHRLSAFTAVSLVGTHIYSREDTFIPNALSLRSTENTVFVSLNRKLSPRTDASIALRWSNFDSNLSPYRERALIGVVAHHF